MCEKPWYVSMIRELVLADFPISAGVPACRFARDFKTIEQRLTHEGESFFTKTLPAFAKSFDLALQKRQPLIVRGFKRSSKNDARPAFLQGLLRLIFDASGWVMDDPCTKSIRLIRQLLLMCKKIEKGFSDELLRQAADDLIEVDQSLPSIDTFVDRGVLWIGKSIVELIFRGIQNPLKHPAMRFAHGPGSVASGADPCEKRRFGTSYSTLESVFRPIPTFFSLRDAAEDPQRVYDRPKEKFGTSRIAFVEKDSSGPRVIGLEPAEYMWCQQGLKNLMYHHIETASIARGQINFTDQTVNRELTKDWENWETLDMSKASDRVSKDLVTFLFKDTALWPYLLASRTPQAELPDGRILFYKKFAPMGSAVCFPVEAVSFYALAVATLMQRGYPQALALRKVFVYGDDIIVPTGSYGSLVTEFSKFGLKFNEDKSCVSGKFRESCGLDSFAGVDVTPVRLRHPYISSDSDLVSLVEFTNSMCKRGYWNSGLTMKAHVEEHLRRIEVKLPESPRGDLPILSWYSDQDTVRKTYKNGLTYVKGWSLGASRLACPPELEGFFLRESLSRGGPVGSIIATKQGPVRHLDRRFSACFRKRKHVLAPEVPTE